MTDPAVNYATYLRIDELLSLQSPRSDEHDELLFITIHQVYELWFQQLLHELDHAGELLDGDDPARFGHTIKRVLTILKTLVAQVDILETMSPLEFLTFRDRLESGSGFQSAQFRELECLLGFKDPAAAVRRRLAEPVLWDRLVGFLVRRGYAVDGADPSAELVRVYREDPAAAELCERLVDLDEGVQEWRYRHVKMVERTIGTKAGTGGSDGAAYLRTTLHRAAFPALWAIRSRL